MDLRASLDQIRQSHSRAILALENGDSNQALKELLWVEAELVGLTEVSSEHSTELHVIAEQQRGALHAFREGRYTDALALVRAVLNAIELTGEGINRARDSPPAIHPN